jgi:4-hydroxy-tetrahydrodipicolinate synthase
MSRATNGRRKLGNYEIVTAVPVAFASDGALDVEGSRAILRYVAQTGNEGAMVLGTTGEFPALSLEERGRLVALSVEELSSRMRVIAHVGAASLFEVLVLLAQAREAGAREVAVITPHYLPVTDESLYDFYTAVSDASEGLDVYPYVYRKRTGNMVNAELMRRVATLPNIVGAKISEEPLEQIAAYREVVPEDFVLYTGADADLARTARFGAHGVVSGVSAVFPKPFRALAAAARSGDQEAVDEAQAAVDDVVRVIGGDMARMKAAYTMLGVPAGVPRMALRPPDHAVLAELERVVGVYA